MHGRGSCSRRAPQRPKGSKYWCPYGHCETRRSGHEGLRHWRAARQPFGNVGGSRNWRWGAAAYAPGTQRRAGEKGDLVMEFDPSEQRYKLEQNRSELLQAEQEIAKAKADAAVVAAQDKVALLKARFDVRRAELDVQKNEL